MTTVSVSTIWAQQERFEDLDYFRDYVAVFGSRSYFDRRVVPRAASRTYSATPMPFAFAFFRITAISS